ncbi:MAG: tetratricopeptide repeat protein [Candidatus Helarchaeota archaeon]|nr:tetratricopeptide repeat protein [Candidatus Helarchaeota archaeon]
MKMKCYRTFCKEIFGMLFIMLILIFGCSTRANLADEFFTAGEFEKAIAEYRKIIEENPQDLHAYIRIGDCFLNINEFEPALDAYKKAIMLNPDLNEIKDNVKVIQLKISQRYLSEKDYKKALKILNDIIKKEPDNIDANYQLGMLYKENNRPDKAKIYFDKIIKIAPDNKKVLDELKLLLEEKKEAEKYFQEGKEFYDWELYYEAYEKFNKSHQLKPDFKDAEYFMHISLGRVCYKKTSLSELWNAISEFGSAMAVYPKRAEPHYLLGMAYQKKDIKDYENPVEEYKKAIELEPNSKIARICREKINQLLKTKEKMEKFWRESKRQF